MDGLVVYEEEEEKQKQRTRQLVVHSLFLLLVGCQERGSMFGMFFAGGTLADIRCVAVAGWLMKGLRSLLIVDVLNIRVIILHVKELFARATGEKKRRNTYSYAAEQRSMGHMMGECETDLLIQEYVSV